MAWKQDPLYAEPKPKKYDRIFCFTCRKNVPSKAMVRPAHIDHQVVYLNKAGEVME